MLSCRVIGALDRITLKLSMGIKEGNKHVILENKEDINRVKSLFWELYEKGENLDLNSIREWTLKNDMWNEKSSKTFLKYIKPISGGTKPRYDGILGSGWKSIDAVIKEIDEECKANK
jgi:hypothetical protein